MLVAGLMSGTSADGIDVAVAEIRGRGWNTRVRIKAFGTVRYPPAVRRRILEVAGGAAVTAGDISQLNFLIGEQFAQACINICRKNRISLKRLKLIGSHGQTIFHQNTEVKYCGTPVRSTLQIGEAAVIAERTGVTTIADFRPADIAAGGQGAPLVPFFDYLMYRHPKRGRVILNIGGIANLTAIPANGTPEHVIAFDTGPGNMIMDALAAQFSGGRFKYDPDGGFAAKGHVSEDHVTSLLSDGYFSSEPPKTAGREQFGAAFVRKHFINRLKRTGGRTSNELLATAAAFTAEAVAQGIRRFVLPKFDIAECLVSGGGAKNGFLMSQLAERIGRIGRPSTSSAAIRNSAPIQVSTLDQFGIPGEAKEAVAFAVLAYQSIHEQPSNLPAATGARHPVILGKLSRANRT